VVAPVVTVVLMDAGVVVTAGVLLLAARVEHRQLRFSGGGAAFEFLATALTAEIERLAVAGGRDCR